MRPTIQNRDFNLPEDGWYQIEVNGRHLNREVGVVQVIDQKAVQSIIKNFDPGTTGMLIDVDHQSHDEDKTTTAYGWLMNVEDRDGQLYGQIRWTNTGRPAVEGGDLRLFSTEYGSQVEWIDKSTARPLALDGLALTNRPNNKGGKPIQNRESQPEQETNMTNIAKQLGLDENATEEDILAAITKLQEDKDDSDKAADDLDKEVTDLRNREADSLLQEHADKIGDNNETQAFWRNRLIEDRDETVKVLNSMPKAQEKKEPSKRIHNRSTTKHPEPVGDGDEVKKSDEQRKVVDSIRIKNRCSHSDAWAQAKRERPDLF